MDLDLDLQILDQDLWMLEFWSFSTKTMNRVDFGLGFRLEFIAADFGLRSWTGP